MAKLETLSANKVSTGTLTKYSFASTSLSLDTQFNLFIPTSATPTSPVPILFYLAGLTCNEDTGAQKGGFLVTAGEIGVAVVCPDTSPRGAGVEGEEEDNVGTGAGFYLNAASDKWKKHYNMYDLIVKEIPDVLEQADLGLDWSKVSIMGHSMGGHGALSLYLQNPQFFKSGSAFAPVCNPSASPWGIKAFTNYLEPNKKGSPPPTSWLANDASHLLSSIQATKGSLHILVDIGTADRFLEQGQLEPKALENAAEVSGRGKGEVEVRMQEGFDHSYYFISTFSPEHIRWHEKWLKG